MKKRTYASLVFLATSFLTLTTASAGSSVSYKAPAYTQPSSKELMSCSEITKQYQWCTSQSQKSSALAGHASSTTQEKVTTNGWSQFYVGAAGVALASHAQVNYSPVAHQAAGDGYTLRPILRGDGGNINYGASFLLGYGWKILNNNYLGLRADISPINENIFDLFQRFRETSMGTRNDELEASGKIKQGPTFSVIIGHYFSDHALGYLGAGMSQATFSGAYSFNMTDGGGTYPLLNQTYKQKKWGEKLTLGARFWATSHLSLFIEGNYLTYPKVNPFAQETDSTNFDPPMVTTSNFSYKPNSISVMAGLLWNF